MQSSSSLKRVLVTGGNSGIGLALCKQLVKDYGCFVYLTSRSIERGEIAVQSIKDECGAKAADHVSLVQLDVGDADSVAKAFATVKAHLQGSVLYGVVNNAGCGLAHRVSNATVIDTNAYGPKRVCEAFLPLIDPKVGRIVNVGSGAGPMYVKKQSESAKKILTSWKTTWDQLDKVLQEAKTGDSFGAYGSSKAVLSVYTMILARQLQKEKSGVLVSCVTPGFIDTAIVKGMGAKKKPAEGTISIRKCLFDKLDASGFYYGSDGVRSPLDVLRNPGEPEYKGERDLDY